MNLKNKPNFTFLTQWLELFIHLYFIAIHFFVLNPCWCQEQPQSPRASVQPFDPNWSNNDPASLHEPEPQSEPMRLQSSTTIRPQNPRMVSASLFDLPQEINFLDFFEAKLTCSRLIGCIDEFHLIRDNYEGYLSYKVGSSLFYRSALNGAESFVQWFRTETSIKPLLEELARLRINQTINIDNIRQQNFLILREAQRILNSHDSVKMNCESIEDLPNQVHQFNVESFLSTLEGFDYQPFLSHLNVRILSPVPENPLVSPRCALTYENPSSRASWVRFLPLYFTKIQESTSEGLTINILSFERTPLTGNASINVFYFQFDLISGERVIPTRSNTEETNERQQSYVHPEAQRLRDRLGIPTESFLTQSEHDHREDIRIATQINLARTSPHCSDLEQRTGQPWETLPSWWRNCSSEIRLLHNQRSLPRGELFAINPRSLRSRQIGIELKRQIQTKASELIHREEVGRPLSNCEYRANCAVLQERLISTTQTESIAQWYLHQITNLLTNHIRTNQRRYQSLIFQAQQTCSNYPYLQQDICVRDNLTSIFLGSIMNLSECSQDQTLMAKFDSNSQVYPTILCLSTQNNSLSLPPIKGFVSTSYQLEDPSVCHVFDLNEYFHLITYLQKIRTCMTLRNHQIRESSNQTISTNEVLSHISSSLTPVLGHFFIEACEDRIRQERRQCHSVSRLHPSHEGQHNP